MQPTPKAHHTLLAACLAFATSACTEQRSTLEPASPTHAQSSSELRDVRRSEAAYDFEQVVSAFDAMYAPLGRKSARYGVTLTQLEREGLARLNSARTDADAFRTTLRFLDALQDAHVSYSPSILSDSSKEIALPLLVTPIEGKYLVYAVGQALASVARGDELISLDGRAPADLVRAIDRVTSVANPRTAEQLSALAITQRSFYLPAALLPEPGTPATLQFRRADGSTYTLMTNWLSTRPAPRLQPSQSQKANALSTPVFRPWAVASDRAQDLLRAHSGDWAQAGSVGSNRPFFFTNAVATTFGMTRVRPSADTLNALGVPQCDETGGFDCYQSFSALYTYAGKRILLMRVPSYVSSTTPGRANAVGYLKAILADFEAQADVLVIDDTNNPGGEVSFALDLYSSLIGAPAINIGFAFHADRRTVNDFRWTADLLAAYPQYADYAKRYQAQADAAEAAYDARRPLAPLFPIVMFDANDDRVLPDPSVRWSKPFIVLANELSFSGGDLFPLLVKTNHSGTVFGQTTAGAGGSVEEALITTYTQASLRLTRSLFAPMSQANQVPYGTLVEDQGVSPDVVHTNTVADFRAGYVNYVEHFSQVAVDQLTH